MTINNNDVKKKANKKNEQNPRQYLLAKYSNEKITDYSVCVDALQKENCFLENI